MTAAPGLSRDQQADPAQQAEVLRIGMLGASHIAQSAVIDASQQTGEILAAVAARDPERARAYATEHGFASVRESYADLIGDDSLDLIYIGLPNGLHAEWTAQALEAGRSVLVEKPFAGNLVEFDRVVARLDTAPGWVWEAYHYDDHPLMSRVLELLASGEIGELREVHVRMCMPKPGPSDARWNFDLAGGALMDVGCYAVHTLHLIAEAAGREINLDDAVAKVWEHDPRIDTIIDARLSLRPSAAATQEAAAAGRVNHVVPATICSSMVHDDVDFSLELIGTQGSIVAPCFVKPQEDDRLIVGTGETTREERLGTVATYVYQLERVRAELRDGVKDTARLARSRSTMAMIDEIYRAAGLPVRPAKLTS